jgi:hypothetical protein
MQAAMSYLQQRGYFAASAEHASAGEMCGLHVLS